ncbi:MAG: hypothetical protein AAFO69_15835, partial [Bacteroidota bacterium]
MTEHLHHTELIDSYLSGTMSPGEQEAFHDLIETDPMLKEEFLFQQSIVAGLQEHRRAELKNRLSSISVGVGIFGLLMNASYQQVMAAALTLGIIGYGTFFALTELAPSNDQDALSSYVESSTDFSVDHPQMLGYDLSDKKDIETIVRFAKEKAQATNTINTNNQDTPAEDRSVMSYRQTKNKKSNKNTASSRRKVVADNSDQQQKIAVPSFILPSVDDVPREEESIDMTSPDQIAFEELGIAEDKEKSKVEVEQVRKEGKIKQYRFEQGKLYLYGDFEGEPYELLEINTKGARKLFFYHDKEYYRLNQFQKSITRFTPIADK